jgi:hypothetical protein
MIIFYSLRFETPPNWGGRPSYLYPPGTGWQGYARRYWVPFSSPPTTRRATVEVFVPTSTRDTRWVASVVFKITLRHGPHRKHTRFVVVVHLMQLPINGLHNTVSNANSIVEAYLPRRCVVTAVVSFVSRCLPSSGSIRHHTLSFTCRCPVSMNILATKMGALNIAPKHKIAIFSKITPTVLIKFWRPSP